MNYPIYQPRSAKELYFAGEPVPSEEEWYTERKLIDCSDCLYDCPQKNRPERLPADAGGKGQCLRHAQYLSDFAFRNVDGSVIILPDEIIQAIRGTEA